MLKNALNIAGIAAQAAANIKANASINISAKKLGTNGAMNFITIAAPKQPINTWPSAPIFQNFILKAGVIAAAIINSNDAFHKVENAVFMLKKVPSTTNI